MMTLNLSDKFKFYCLETIKMSFAPIKDGEFTSTIYAMVRFYITFLKLNDISDPRQPFC